MNQKSEKEALRIRKEMTEIRQRLEILYSDAEDVIADLEQEIEEGKSEEEESGDFDNSELIAAISNLDDWMNACERSFEALQP